uniref:Lysosomal acid phosphatase n=1 Tax=Elaeophora elaphi TaxID=1147741 RepID=A0A0R3RW06_9BILA
MWRHGDRTPISLLPNDTANDEQSWEIGLGELTTDGIWQAYQLGKFLRRRYDGFLNETFQTSEVYVRSTDVNRTLMTATAVLQSLYPQTYHRYDRLLSVWRPVPVHTLQAEKDKQLLQQDCAKVSEELQQVLKTEAVQELLKSNDGFFRYIGEHMNVDGGNYDLDNIWLVYDPLKVITYHKDKHQFPKWVNETIWNKISEMYHLWGYYQYSTDLLKRLQGGELWKEIFARLNNLMKERSVWKQKLYAYSAHDDTLAVLLSMFGLKVTTYPEYTALVLLETHQINNQFVLQLYYKNVTDSDQIYQFPIAYCDGTCTVAKLETATRNFVPLNWDMECDPFVLYKKMSTAILFLSMISIVAIISCQILKSHLMKRKVYGGRTILPSDADMALLRENVIR